MLNRFKAATMALHPWQAGVVLAVFVVTALGAAALLWGFTKWNARQERNRHGAA